MNNIACSLCSPKLGEGRSGFASEYKVPYDIEGIYTLHFDPSLPFPSLPNSPPKPYGILSKPRIKHPNTPSNRSSPGFRSVLGNITDGVWIKER